MIGMLATPSFATTPADSTAAVPTSPAAIDSVGSMPDQTLHEVSVVSRKPGMMRMKGALNGQIISQDELFKAACCNLGESFTTNPSCSDSAANTCRCSPRTCLTSAVPPSPIP